MNTQTSYKRQQGLVLIVSLLLLLAMALLAMAVSQTNLQQLQMSGNDQAKAESMQHGLAIVDSIISDKNNTAVVGDVGFRLCDIGLSSGCDDYLINVDPAVLDADATIEYYVERVGPELTSAPFLDEENAGSAAAFSVARQEIVVEYDRSSAGLGKVRLAQGLLRLIPKTVQ
ncbi:hypothetical protein DWB85_12930 [Seongchinamella sediminis]|uniref:Type 4 fimbrial biogenesis protein PilX N-terminal domain-containing protein n=1 Tax=Seongchinamella sediminis TaxID=2283635 RepID=A0A3L7DXS8_9GAMM|nr:PilX N-terminal domain-containing pilus assembly protein [Seongchinamella sediminis]RLQ21419.1 hypothetical protein DWB85_12930 [Seongchinamella sediminis]